MAVEDWLDRYFEDQGWRIERTTAHEERTLHLGDRRFHRDGACYLVEYKSGLQTAQTGNVFLETISVDTAGIPGWVYTCQADYLLYAAILNHIILVFEPSRLRTEIENLKHMFREVQTGRGQNRGYNTHGVIVPLSYAEQHLASKILRID
jgi:hypothetical protein